MKKKIFITGTSRGIGKALAEKLLEQDQICVEGFSRECTISHPQYKHFTVDLTANHGLRNVSFQNDEQAQCLVLINNAGTLGEIDYIGRVSDESLEKGVYLNLTVPMVLTNRFLMTFETFQGMLIIINISSGAAWNPYDGWGMYCATKAGLDMFAGVLAMELKIKQKKSVHIFSVAPGVVDTAMQDQIRASNADGFSSLAKFQSLKQDGALQDTHQVASRLIKLIQAPELYHDFKVDISHLS
ncbi:MAG: SDR family NAD(P)-dependent oxidoreductase [Flavobacteriales bacterium]